ncbi:MAG: twin-arginine translocase subunit TatC [Pyrinomonadaceae bacterium]|nr:twin-arginine translocase subunit TatC [Pyrinomonadaceae bacterium]
MEEIETEPETERGGHMSFLDHLDELRKRLVNCVIIIVVAFTVCWFVSDKIYNFLSIPIRQALSDAARSDLPISGVTGAEKVLSITDLKEGDAGRYVFDRSTKLGPTVVVPGSSVSAQVLRDPEGKLGLFTSEQLLTNNAIVPKGVRLPLAFDEAAISQPNADERMIVTTAQEQFTLYVTVSLYGAIALSVPLLLWQIWMFISPALYKHERAYVTPFIGLSTVSFVVGAAFAYYILFPPAAAYLLGIGGGEFQLLLRASDYLDLITIIMLAMGVIFQMPAITYVLSRIGIITAGLLVKSWKISLVIILIVAAVVSPTGDIPNMMLFAAPMVALYIVSIFIAWFFGKKRQTTEEVENQAT